MAARDFNFSKFLIEALSYKISRGRTDTYYSNGQYSLPYNGKLGIFYFARKYFPLIYSNKHKLTGTDPEKDLEANLNFAQEIIFQLNNHKDPELEKYLKAETAPTESDSFHQEVEQSVDLHLKDLEQNPNNYKFAGAEHKLSATNDINPKFPSTPTIKPRFKIPEEVKNTAKEAEFQLALNTQKAIPKVIKFVTGFFKGVFGGGSNFEIVGQPANASQSTIPIEEPAQAHSPASNQTRKQGLPTRRLGRNPLSSIGNLGTTNGKRFLIIIFIGIALFALFAIIFFGAPPTTQQSQINNLIIEKTGITQVENGGTIEYQLTVTNKGSGYANIELTDKVPDGTEFVESSDGTKPDGQKNLKWIINRVNSSEKWSVKFKVTPIKDNIWVVNQASATSLNLTPSTGSGDISSCTFYRGTSGAKFSSPLLISYINRASQISGIPATVLAGIVKVESTVGADSATGKAYSISNYSDEDVKAMSDTSRINTNIDQTIDGAEALCPRSATGALGITQIQPGAAVLDQVKEIVPQGNTYTPNYQAHPDLTKGLQMLKTAGLLDQSKTDANLTVEDYCDPQKNLILSAGVILSKLGIDKWETPTDPKAYEELVNKVATRYYGQDGQTDLYSSSLWRSVSSCLVVSSNAPDFDNLMRGQGRNLTVLGSSEDQFIANLKTNLQGTARASLLNEENRLRQIYQATTARQVNPLVVLTTWGTEAGFDRAYDKLAFGCDPPREDGTGGRFPGFESQLQCSINTWNNLMNEFEAKAQQGIPVSLNSQIGKICQYEDPFIYAAERYGPVCVVNDANENYRKSFYNIYKMLVGAK